MAELNRKEFVKSLAVVGGTLATWGASEQQAKAQTEAGSRSRIEKKNGVFSLILEPSGNEGLSTHLVHVPTGTVLADGLYSFSFGPVNFAVAENGPESISLKGTTSNGLEVQHTFRLRPGSPWLEEEIAIRNTTVNPIRDTFRCGFVLPAQPETFSGYTFTAVPFRREPRDGSHQYQDFSLQDVLHLPRRSVLREDSNPPRVYENYFAEGWTLTNGTNGFLLTKYNPLARDFAILDRVPVANGQTGLRWGGAGIDPSDAEAFRVISPGATQSFGVSRLTAFQGDLTQGFYTFREEMASRGHGVPAGYNPPVHWNELYDNKLWWLQTDGGQDSVENRKKYYTLDDLKAEAAKAKAIGCEALYCDPGWDTNFASKIWDTARLGKLTDFVAMLHHDYGLKLSLHTPLSGWGNTSSYPLDCFRMDKAGNRSGQLCGASHQYIDETVKRLNVLAEAGAVYFMFDGTMYLSDPCWNAAHGHPLPLTCAAHVEGTNLIARKVHEKYPSVSIEMHDQVMGYVPVRYVPLYYGHGKDASGASSALGFDTVWAFEMMWEPMRNLRSGQSIALYYYNLAYSLPLYLHIDLRTDNQNALVFWWNASTCRYFGIGGTHPDPKVNEAHFVSMKAYMRLKPYYAAGTFYGIDEMTHVHRHPTGNTAVINCFAVQDGDATREVHFEPSKFGLKADKEYKFTGATFAKNGASYVGKVTIAAQGHTLVEVTEV